MTTAYTELAATRWERRRELLRHHQFDIDAATAARIGTGTADGAEPAAEPAGSSADGSGADAAGSSAAAAGAAAGAAGAAAAAVLQCLPEQQPAAVLPLVLEGGAAELRLYGGQLPPWPHDARDVELTAVVPTAAGSSGSSGCGMGMWGSLGQADGLAPAPASASFDVADEADCTAVGSAVAAAAQEAHQPPVFVVHCWAVGQQISSQQLRQLAQQYAAALQLQQCLDSLLSSGEAATATTHLQQALQALSGRPAGPAGGRAAALTLGPRHVLRMRLLSDLHRAAVAAGEWEAALVAAYQLLPLYQAAYQPVRLPCWRIMVTLLQLLTC